MKRKYTIIATVLAALVLAIVAPYSVHVDAASGVYPEGMISYWKFDEGTGSTAADSAGVNPGTIYGATWTSGIVGNALIFDGVDDYVDVPQLSGVTNQLTTEAWVNPDFTDTLIGYVIHFNGQNPLLAIQGERCHDYEVGAVRFAIHTDQGRWVPDTHGVPFFVTENEWVHLVSVYDGNAQTLTLFVNGDQIRQFAGPNGNVDLGTSTKIGAFRPGDENYHFFGIIDEVAIYNRALTAEEIQQHYQNGLSGLGYEEATVIEVEIDRMFIDFNRQLNKDDIDIKKATFCLQEGATYDLAVDEVTVSIDGVNISIPAGSFEQLGQGEKYRYKSPQGVKPKIVMELNFDKGKWELKVRDIDASAVNNCDGVDVTLVIGSMSGSEHVNMWVERLSYSN